MHEVCQSCPRSQTQQLGWMNGEPASPKRESGQRTKAGATLRAMRLHRILLIAALLCTAGCHPGPVIHSDPNMDVGGTIAGIVSTTSNNAVPDRKVTAIDTVKGARFEATTGVNGGFTIKVPQGTYRLELELREGERVTKQPGETKINNSDLDPKRDFVITGSKS
jgi:hypothetical protein